MVNLFAYKLNKKGLFKKDKMQDGLALPSENWSTYSQIQGISFDKNNILLSTSYGDFNSQLLIFKNKLNNFHSFKFPELIFILIKGQTFPLIFFIISIH